MKASHKAARLFALLGELREKQAEVDEEAKRILPGWLVESFPDDGGDYVEARIEHIDSGLLTVSELASIEENLGAADISVCADGAFLVAWEKVS